MISLEQLKEEISCSETVEYIASLHFVAADPYGRSASFSRGLNVLALPLATLTKKSSRLEESRAGTTVRLGGGAARSMCWLQRLRALFTDGMKIAKRKMQKATHRATHPNSLKECKVFIRVSPLILSVLAERFRKRAAQSDMRPCCKDAHFSKSAFLERGGRASAWLKNAPSRSSTNRASAQREKRVAGCRKCNKYEISIGIKYNMSFFNTYVFAINSAYRY